MIAVGGNALRIIGSPAQAIAMLALRVLLGAPPQNIAFGGHQNSRAGVTDVAEEWNRIVEQAGHDMHTLSSDETTVYWVFRFLSDVDNGGLTGFLYNVSPKSPGAWSNLRRTGEAVAAVGDTETASLLEMAARELEKASARRFGAWSETLRDALPQVDILEQNCTERSDVLWISLERFTIAKLS